MDRDWQQEKADVETRIALVTQTIDELEAQRAEALRSNNDARHNNAEELTNVITTYKNALASYQASLANINDVLGMQADQAQQEEEFAALRSGLEALLAEYEAQLDAQDTQGARPEQWAAQGAKQ